MQLITQERFGHVLHGCPKLSTHLSLQGLACLSASSKGLRHGCHAAASCNVISLLDPALEKSRGGQLQEQHKQAVVWLAALLQEVGTPTAAARCASRLRALPSVPLKWVVQLVEAGVRISYAQLLAAANSMLAGVEVWVQAQQQLGVQADIPATAVAVCCGDDWDIAGLPEDEATALLQLAMNCSNPTTAEAAAHRLPEQLEAGVALKLRLTAAARQHTAAVQHMIGLQPCSST